MLSDEEKRQMREDAHSEALRRDFALLQTPPLFPPDTPINVDELLDFLTTMSRLCPTPPPPREPIPYRIVRL